MGFWDTVVGKGLRYGGAIATGGASLLVDEKTRNEAGDALAKLDPTKVGKADTSGVTGAMEDAKKQQEDFRTALSAAQTRQLPTTAEAQMIDRSGVQNATAQQVAAPRPVRANTVAAPTPVVAPTADPRAFLDAVSRPAVNTAIAAPMAANNVNLSGLTASQTAGVLPSTASQVQGVTAAPVANADTFAGRLAQQQGIDLARQAAMGQGPSAARSTLDQSTGQAIRAAMATMASSRGMQNSGAMTRALANQTAEQVQAGGATAAQLAANEQIAARGQMLDALNASRTQDINLAGQEATLGLDAAKFSAGAQNTALGQDAALQAAALTSDADRELAAAREKANLEASLATSDANRLAAANTATTGFNVDLARGDQATELARQQANQQSALAGQDAALKASLANQATDTQVSLANQDASLRAALANQQTGTQVALANADNALRASLANQGVDLEVLKSNAAAGNTVALANLDAALRAQGLNDAMVQSYLQAITQTQGQTTEAQLRMFEAEQGRQASSAAARSAITGGIIGGLSSAGAAVATGGKK